MTAGAAPAIRPSDYNTDKDEHFWGNYERFFAPWAGRETAILELGVRHGGSLLLWRDYFAGGPVVGLDHHAVEPVEDETGRVHIYQGGQQDLALLSEIAERHAPGGFDLIIDDASHIGELSRVSFGHLFTHHLKSGGLYVVEDWGTGYWPTWEDGAVGDRPDFRPQRPAWWRRIAMRLGTPMFQRRFPSHDYGMVGFVKEFVDEVGRGAITHETNGAPPHENPAIDEMTVCPGQVFLRKR